MNKKLWIKVSTLTIFLILAFSPSSRVTRAQSDQLIAAFNGRISDTYITRYQTVYIDATLVNFGDQPIEVETLKADFVHLQGNSRYNTTYTYRFDRDHNSIEPGDSITGTIKTEITNPEAGYNVTIYFLALDAYHPHPELGAYNVKYIAAENITVSVVDFGGASNVIMGIGIAFAVAIGGVIIFILYGWIKDKISKRKY